MPWHQCDVPESRGLPAKLSLLRLRPMWKLAERLDRTAIPQDTSHINTLRDVAQRRHHSLTAVSATALASVVETWLYYSHSIDDILGPGRRRCSFFLNDYDVSQQIAPVRISTSAIALAISLLYDLFPHFRTAGRTADLPIRLGRLAELGITVRHRRAHRHGNKWH